MLLVGGSPEPRSRACLRAWATSATRSLAVQTIVRSWSARLSLQPDRAGCVRGAQCCCARAASARYAALNSVHYLRQRSPHAAGYAMLNAHHVLTLLSQLPTFAPPQPPAPLQVSR